MARRENRPGGCQDHDAHGVVGLGCGERVVELNQQATVLGVSSLRPIEGDARDRSFIECLVGHEAVSHVALPIWSWPPADDPLTGRMSWSAGGRQQASKFSRSPISLSLRPNQFCRTVVVSA